MSTDGLCECGCGGRTSIAPQSITSRGIRNGEPYRFIQSHSSRCGPPLEKRYVVAPDGCWLWAGELNPAGYGMYWYPGGARSTAHRAMWQQHYGVTLPSHLHVDHQCGRLACVNPEHMLIATPATNMRRRSSSKLNEQTAREIAESTDHVDAVAGRYGISRWTVYDIRQGRRWAANDTSEADHYNRLAQKRTTA